MIAGLRSRTSSYSSPTPAKRGGGLFYSFDSNVFLRYPFTKILIQPFPFFGISNGKKKHSSNDSVVIPRMVFPTCDVKTKNYRKTSNRILGYCIFRLPAEGGIALEVLRYVYQRFVVAAVVNIQLRINGRHFRLPAAELEASLRVADALVHQVVKIDACNYASRHDERDGSAVCIIATASRKPLNNSETISRQKHNT